MKQERWGAETLRSLESDERLLARLAKRLLASAARGYGRWLELRYLAYRRQWLAQRTLPGSAVAIGVGNLSAGGSGKTPIVSKLVDLFSDRWHIGVVTRGWQGLHDSYCHGLPRLLSDSMGPLFTANYSGDEPRLLLERHPQLQVWIGRDRYRVAQAAIDQGCQLLLFDDGFHDLGIKKDYELVVIDAKWPPWRDHLLPRGLLREKTEALARADFVLFNHVTGGKLQWLALEQELAAHQPLKSAALVPSVVKICSCHGTIRSSLQGRRAALFSGIAHPDRFEATAQEIGLEIVARCHFSDHLTFQGEASLFHFAREAKLRGADLLLCTEKDAVKWLEVAPRLPLPLYWPHLELDLVAGQELWQQWIDQIDGLLHQRMGSARTTTPLFSKSAVASR